jgi:hypothetical protein
MRYEWDESKDRENKAAHKIGFEAALQLDWQTALIFVDDREDYGELREVAIGFIGDGLHHLVFSSDDDQTARIISLRKATN